MSGSGRVVGKVAIVTGAGQQPGETIGNGRAIAMRLAQEGAAVLCVDRDAERAADVVEAILGEGGEARACVANVVTDAGAIVAAAMSAWGKVDILVNNVGIGHRGDGPVQHASEEAIEKVFEVNFNTARRMTAAVLPAMRAAESGSIVNISSLASIAGANMLAYEVSKAAIDRMTVATALSSARRGVRCNAILPGLIDTPMGVGTTAQRDGRSIDEQRAVRAAKVPLKGGMGSAWDIANAALFLASDEARFVSGVLLRVDGAMGARIG